ncbi:MAG: hypothetical protein HY926_07735 [Elusimicrobia bacterium]|nr:hypothetical protein [Elusimicrobiota bacterium]
MKNLISATAALLLAAPAFAAGGIGSSAGAGRTDVLTAGAPSLESAQAAAMKSFQMPAVKLSFQKGAKVKDAVPGKAAAGAVAAKAGGYVRVSGHVNLNGNGYVPTIPGYASVNLRGSANICDPSGQVCSGYTTITTWSNVFVNGNFVTDWLRPYLNVSFYKGGRYVGSGQVSGSIPVSGWVNGNWVFLNGSGYLDGNVLVNE